METTITKLDVGKIQVKEGNKLKWYDVESWVKPEFYDLGDALVDIKGGKVAFIVMNNKKRPEENEDSNGSNDMTNFKELLEAAHKKGLSEIVTSLVEDGQGKVLLDYTNKRAVFKAVVTLMNKEGLRLEFTGHGDAENIQGEVKKSWLRMAETRAIVRALRFATNNASVAEEETK